MKTKTWIILGSVMALAVAVPVAFNRGGSGGTCGLMKKPLAETFSKRNEPLGAFSADKDVERRVAAAAAPARLNAAASVSFTKKLIKNAYVTLKVRDCVKTKDSIVGLVERRKGTVMNAQLEQEAELRKNGQVVFKVRPEELEAVLGDVRRLGKVKSESVNVQDVTETYVDLQSRLNNLRMVRDRFVNLLNEKAKQVKDIVEIEKELSRVGGEIEAMEGRLKYLDSQIDLSTVTVNFFEERAGLLGGLDLGEKFAGALKSAAMAFV
ncbi:MAG TPA: DUF4349 domain-containing protein, partial [Candidatus Omnitrophota bacterium]|nr:DUF4349 domain-containing protein [Candidatus Omnitrophota bacterium]